MKLNLSDRITKPDFQGEFTASILAAAASPDIISFAGGLPNPVSFPIPEMEAATKKVLEENGVTALQYSSTAGWPALRQWIAKRYETMGVTGVSPDDIIVTNGSQQALAMVSAALINTGDKIIVEDPTYLVALQSFHVFDPVVLPVTMNPDGIDCDELAETIISDPEFPEPHRPELFPGSPRPGRRDLQKQQCSPARGQPLPRAAFRRYRHRQLRQGTG